MRPLLVPLIVLAVWLPQVQGTWSSFGAWEPDTFDDEAAGWMFVNADQSAGTSAGRAYFNAFAIIDGGAAALVVPNAGAIGSRLIPSTNLGYAAVIGIWKDCNLDETIGAAQAALWTYSRILLPAGTPCSAGSPHVRGDFVHEFIQISPHQVAGAAEPILVDESAAVWGDFGRPDTSVHYDCTQVPVPSGTMSRTGGLLRYIDCQLQFRVTSAVDALARQAGRPELMFDDPRHPEESCANVLNQHLPLWSGPDACAAPDDRPGLLEKDTGEPAFEVWDCANDGDWTEVRDPLAPDGSRGALSGVHIEQLGIEAWLADESGAYHRVPPPGVPTLSARGSLHDGARDFESGLLHDCGRANMDEVDVRAVVERDVASNDASWGKRSSDFVLSFVHDHQGDGLVQRSARTTLQEAPAGAPAWGARAWWRSDYVYGPPTFMGVTVRPDLQPAGATSFTFYAWFSPAAAGSPEIPAGAHGVYGAEACAGAETGVIAGWDCEAAHWWNPELGGTRNARGKPVGHAYLMRDTDCYDNSVLWGAASASLASVSTEGVCP